MVIASLLFVFFQGGLLYEIAGALGAKLFLGIIQPFIDFFMGGPDPREAEFNAHVDTYVANRITYSFIVSFAFIGYLILG